MCTVTYLPKNNGDFILTSSRDEKTIRPAALEPMEYTIGNNRIIFPQDPSAKGTWIAFSENRVACLLNGGFEKHISSPPYKKSRGLALLDFFSYDSAPQFAEKYTFDGIEPFTLILIENNSVYELRWDSQRIYNVKYNSSQPAIWSSVTLYDYEVIKKRKNWFQEWLTTNKLYSTELIRDFHKNGGDGDHKNDILMNRSDTMKTVSITSIEKSGQNLQMIHQDLLHQKYYTKSCAFAL